jgi:hypothetical protein
VSGLNQPTIKYAGYPVPQGGFGLGAVERSALPDAWHTFPAGRVRSAGKVGRPNLLIHNALRGDTHPAAAQDRGAWFYGAI